MYTQYHLSHGDAQAVVAAIIDELEAGDLGAAVAVVDAHGELLAFLRTDGCPLPSINNAIHKAFTAARERRTSWEIGQSSRVEEFPLTNFGDLRYTGWGGGAPLFHEGALIGAIGVSGLPETDDMALAELGASRFRDRLASG